jgi:hypothetical protein
MDAWFVRLAGIGVTKSAGAVTGATASTGRRAGRRSHRWPGSVKANRGRKAHRGRKAARCPLGGSTGARGAGAGKAPQTRHGGAYCASVSARCLSPATIEGHRPGRVLAEWEHFR